MTIPLRVAGIGLILLALVWLQVQGPRDSQLIWALPVGLALGVLFIYFLKYRPARTRLELLRSARRVQRAFGFYNLAVLLARRGENALAQQTYEEDQQYWPSLKLPSPHQRLAEST